LKTMTKRLYEAMFLVDSSLAASDWDGIGKTITSLLERSGAEIVSLKRWDERKLAYDIQGKSRGTYILCFFRADGGKVQDIERDVRLSERIMRVLVLTAESREADVHKDTPATLAEKRAAPAPAAAPRDVAEEPDEREESEDAEAAEESDSSDEPVDEESANKGGE
jgi:small subunit ribosomal protein S6